jgi:uncharacterized protein YciW
MSDDDRNAVTREMREEGEWQRGDELAVVDRQLHDQETGERLTSMLQYIHTLT